jgi:cytochrome P450
VRRVLSDDGDFVRNTQPTETLFGKSLLRLEGEPWRRRRTLLAPPFRREAMTEAIAIIHDEIDQLIASWRIRSEVFGPTRDLSACLLRILCRFAFGFDFDVERHGGSPLHRALAVLSADSILRLFLPRPVVWAMNGRGLGRARATLDRLANELLDKGRDTPLMRTLRTAMAERTIDRAAAIDELRTLMIAGHETSATAIAWSIALLAQHRELAEPVRAEGARAAEVREIAELAELRATNGWVKETMRLFPPVPVSVWQTTRATELGRFTLARGTRVDISSYVIHRLARQWPEPERFDPSRFSSPPPFGSYLPFLAGPHTCMGIHLAMVELPLITARLADAFEFELPEGPPRVNLRLSLHPAGLRIRTHPRHAA